MTADELSFDGARLAEGIYAATKTPALSTSCPLGMKDAEGANLHLVWLLQILHNVPCSIAWYRGQFFSILNQACLPRSANLSCL